MIWRSPIKAEDARSTPRKPKRLPPADHAGDGRGVLCAGHDGLHPGRRGLEGARSQVGRAVARRHRHQEPRPFARRTRRAHHSGCRYRDGWHGRSAHVSKPAAGAVQQIHGRHRGRAAANTRDRRARYRRQLALFVPAGNTALQQWRPALLRLPSRHRRQGASYQRDVSIAPYRATDDPALKACHQAGRQFWRRADGRDRKRLLQQLLPRIPARPRRRNQPAAQ